MNSASGETDDERFRRVAAMPPGRDVLTLELKINFLRPGRGDRLVSRGRVLRAGRTAWSASPRSSPLPTGRSS